MTASQLLAVMNSPEYKFYDENYVFKKVKDFRGFSAVGVSSQVLCNRDEIRLYSANGNGLMYESNLFIKLTENLTSGDINPTAKIFIDDKELLYAYHRGITCFGNGLVFSTDKKTIIERLIDFLKKLRIGGKIK